MAGALHDFPHHYDFDYLMYGRRESKSLARIERETVHVLISTVTEHVQTEDVAVLKPIERITQRRYLWFSCG